jgi:ubiquinone/menaquinone biosynthesis C-methylase UbiE/ADP-ribose pyrophosphatase YjhB (NUDIX family)
MPDLTSAALFERDGRVLVAHRRRPPFAAQWVLPMTMVGADEAAEDALRRHARDQFGVGLGEETFVETVYLVDPDDQAQYVANIFRTPIVGGPMRFNTEGDYDDARWLAPADLDQLWMPPDLRVPLVQILTSPETLHETDWSRAGEGVPLAEREGAVGAQPAAPAEPAPDNRVAWDTIAMPYQTERRGDRFGTKLMWSWRASEDELHVLDDVRGKRAVVLGCGGGQDVVALANMGAIAIGIDYSPRQLEYAREYARRNAVDNASFIECGIEDLARFDDASFDLAVSIFVLDYVEHIERALAEAARVLRPAGVLAIAVKHPLGARTDGGPPYTIWTSYWTAHADWPWEFKDGTSAPLRRYYHTMSQWFELLTSAGFAVERLMEPKEDELERGPGDALDNRWLGLMPYTLIMKARKR